MSQTSHEGDLPSSASARLFSPPPLLRWCCSGIRPCLNLLLLCVTLFLPGIYAIPPTDRDEARYVQATRQMMESGDFVTIRVQQTAREKKPVGIHWLQAAATLPFGGSAAPLWAYRLPSVVSAILAVLLTFSIGSQLFRREAAFVGALVLASSLVLVAEAHLAKTDATLLATVVAAVGLLVKAFAVAPLSRTQASIFWVALGAGTLVKGPVLPGLTATTGLALFFLFRDTRRGALVSLRPLFGIPLFFILVAPWAIAISIASNGAFFSRAIAGDIAPKLLGVHESHGGFPGYYTSLLLFTFWPWSIVAVPALGSAWRGRHEIANRAMAAWFIPGLLVIEIVPTKLPHYVLPLIPPLALWVGHWLTSIAQSGTITRRRSSLFVTSLWLLSTSGLAIFFIAASAVFEPRTLVISIPIAIVLGALVYRVGFAKISDPAALVLPLLLSASSLYLLFFGALFHGLSPLWLSRSLHQELSERKIDEPSSIVIAGYQEPSAVFLIGTKITLTDGAGAAEALRSGRAATAVVEERQLVSFREALGECSNTLTELERISGFNYSKGKYMTLHLLQRSNPCAPNELKTNP